MKTCYSYYFKLPKDKQQQITMFTRQLVYVHIKPIYLFSVLVHVPVLQSMYT